MRTERVILIDDNETDNFFHSIALKKAGFEGEVQAFERPEEGLAFLLKDQIQVPTCVFLDINMPQINGFTVARTLAERLKPHAGFSLFMLSSSNWSADAREAKGIPLIAGFLVKPLTTSTAAKLLFESGD